jgi:hypothetical protein
MPWYFSWQRLFALAVVWAEERSGKLSKDASPSRTQSANDRPIRISAEAPNRRLLGCLVSSMTLKAPVPGLARILHQPRGDGCDRQSIDGANAVFRERFRGSGLFPAPDLSEPSLVQARLDLPLRCTSLCNALRARQRLSESAPGGFVTPPIAVAILAR